MTYAIHRFDWPSETLADMQARRRIYEMQADRIGRDDPAASRMWQDMADAECQAIAAHMAGVAHRAARIQHDRDDTPDGTPPPRWLRYAIGGTAIMAGIVWGIPLACAALAWIGGGV